MKNKMSYLIWYFNKVMTLICLGHIFNIIAAEGSVSFCLNVLSQKYMLVDIPSLVVKTHDWHS